MEQITIGRLARDAGVGIDTVRFYERAGLLPPPARTPAGYRLYRPADVERLRFIRRAKALGFTLEEIRELLALADGGGRRSAVRELASRRLADVEHRLEALERIRETLGHLVHECDGDGPLAGCPIIEAVAGPSDAARGPSPATTTNRRRAGGKRDATR